MAEDVSAVSARGSHEPTAETVEERGRPTVGETFALLADRRDRYALYYLHSRDGVTDLDALVKQVLAWEAGDRPTSYPPEQVARVVEEFAVERLPRLRRAGLVEYNLRTGCVVFTEAAADVTDYLEVAIADEPFRGTPADPFQY